MSTSSEYKLLSHPRQLLIDHLTGVSQISRDILITHGNNNELLTEVVEKICMAHDFGKATSFFQKYIRNPSNKKENKNHSLISAVFAFWWFNSSEHLKEYRLLAYLAIKRHHGKIRDVKRNELNVSDVSIYPALQEQIIDIRDNLETRKELEKIYSVNLDGFFEFALDKNTIYREIIQYTNNDFLINSSIDNAFLFEYVWSILLSADKLQLAIKDVVKLPPNKPAKYFETYKNKVRDIIVINSPDIVHTDIFQMRNEIFRNVAIALDTIDVAKYSFYSLNLPVGTGKTLVSYYTATVFANRLEQIYGCRSKIVYALPYMSIIDQNVNELTKIIKLNELREPLDTEILKCHSLAKLTYENEQIARKEDDIENKYVGYNIRFLRQNWQANIIATTFVQFMDTIFGMDDNNKMQRFHQLQNAVVILDEIQVLDEKYYAIIKNVLTCISKKYNTKFIFVTATMPTIVETHPLLECVQQYFDRLNRFTIYNHIRDPVEIDDFVNIVLSHIQREPNKSFLITLNTVEIAGYVYDQIKQYNISQKVLYISRDIYPKARLQKINAIKDSKQKLVVVTTPLVEAGVDIDLDIAYRDFAPLSSIVQIAGRVNRNGLKGDSGEVHVYCIMQKNRYYCELIYGSFLMNITLYVMQNIDSVKECDLFHVNQQYMELVAQGCNKSVSDDIYEHITNFRFEKAAEEFQLIKEDYMDKHDIVIAADEECKKIIQQLKQGIVNDKNLFKQLNEYTISVNSTRLRLITQYIDHSLEENYNILVLPMKIDDTVIYSKRRGIVFDSNIIKSNEPSCMIT